MVQLSFSIFDVICKHASINVYIWIKSVHHKKTIVSLQKAWNKQLFIYGLLLQCLFVLVDAWNFCLLGLLMDRQKWQDKINNTVSSFVSSKSYGVEMSWGWVNDNRAFIFGLSIPSRSEQIKILLYYHTRINWHNIGNSQMTGKSSGQQTCDEHHDEPNQCSYYLRAF